MRQIILASASPRREYLLKQIGLDFQVIPSRVEEVVDPDLEPHKSVLALADQKTRSVSMCYPEAIVLGADTAVCCEGQVLGKPRDAQDAYQMLKLLSGRTHEVISGVVLRQEKRKLIKGEVVSTKVRFRQLNDAEITGYISTGESLDKAGAYGIQGFGALLVAEIKGCYFNVVGLPLGRLPEMFREFGVDLLCQRKNIASP